MKATCTLRAVPLKERPGKRQVAIVIFYWWFTYDVIKNLVIRIMINLTQILI